VGFYRFEQLKSHHFNPHLSSTQGPIIEGQYMYFRRVKKTAGSKSTLHYHPNEFMAFLLEGKLATVVGDGRRVAREGTLIHIPPYAQHSFKSDSDLNYLYIKDRTWTMIGAAADEALPGKALSATHVARMISAGRYPGGKKAPEKSRAITKGLGNCYYPMIERLDAPDASGYCERWMEGVNLAFGFIDAPAGHRRAEKKAQHEIFVYVIGGTLDTRVGRKKHRARSGDVIHVPRGTAYEWTVTGKRPARYATVRSTVHLEQEVARNGAADNWRG
jgi:quercetin dioxygenase-like cupin family protein